MRHLRRTREAPESLRGSPQPAARAAPCLLLGILHVKSFGKPDLKFPLEKWMMI